MRSDGTKQWFKCALTHLFVEERATSGKPSSRGVQSFVGQGLFPCSFISASFQYLRFKTVAYIPFNAISTHPYSFFEEKNQFPGSLQNPPELVLLCHP